MFFINFLHFLNNQWFNFPYLLYFLFQEMSVSIISVVKNQRQRKCFTILIHITTVTWVYIQQQLTVKNIFGSNKIELLLFFPCKTSLSHLPPCLETCWISSETRMTNSVYYLHVNYFLLSHQTLGLLQSNKFWICPYEVEPHLLII